MSLWFIVIPHSPMYVALHLERYFLQILCFDSSIGFFGVSLQSFFSRVVPLLKITWIPSFWSSLLKISENPFTYGTLKDFSKSSFVYFLSHQFFIYGECISERSCLQYLLESNLQWMYLSEIPVPHCYFWFLCINHMLWR